MLCKHCLGLGDCEMDNWKVVKCSSCGEITKCWDIG